MTTLNISQKNVNDGKNTFFKNNKMLIGTAAPTSGTYTRGDVVVNAGLDNDKNNMWICIESGSPGKWILIGGKPMITSRARVVITDPIAEVPMTELGMPVEKDDKLDVYLNSTHLLEGEDYIINSSGTKIRKKSGIWNLTGDPAVFDFVLMKYVDKVDGNNVTINTENRETKIASIVEKVQIVGTQTEVAIPNMNFNQEFDTLLVFKNGMIMIDGIDYQISNGNLVSLTGPWNQSNVDDYEMTFILLKEVLVYEGETFGNFQEKIDSNLQTNDKTVVGAINELFQNANNGEALEDFQEKIDNNLQTESKTVVGAINELFQSANNGKELIASAIGEPVSSEDTFQAMSDDINGLLSTFKTNMMNNGITVEPGDRFKSLIDKIATMVEEGSGKGIRYVQGSYTYTSEKSDSVTVQTNLGFTPQYFVVVVNGMYVSGVNDLSASGNKYMVLTTDCPYHGYQMIWSDGGVSSDRVLNLAYDANSFTISGGRLKYVHFQNGVTFNWHAFGVGEEDNTLRDSLASILQEEGVSVTNEDDMASLISKVDQEFDKQVVPVGTATASDVLSGKTFINSTGSTVTGTITNQGSKTITPSTSNQTLPAGYYSGITINGDSDLKASNIRKGYNLFGVSGTLVAFQTIQYQGVGVYSNIAYNGATYTGSVQYNSSGIYNYPVVAVCTYDMTVTSSYKLKDKVSTITFDATDPDNVFQNGGSSGYGSTTTSLDMSIDRSVSGRCSFTLKVGGNGGSIYVNSVSLYMLRP